MKTASYPGTSQWLARAILLSKVHQSRHLILSQDQLLAPPVSKGDVRYKDTSELGEVLKFENCFDDTYQLYKEL